MGNIFAIAQLDMQYTPAPLLPSAVRDFLDDTGDWEVGARYYESQSRSQFKPVFFSPGGRIYVTMNNALTRMDDCYTPHHSSTPRVVSSSPPAHKEL